MKDFDSVVKAIEQEISRIEQDIQRKIRALDDQENSNLQDIVDAVADMESAILANDSDQYAAAVQRKTTAEAKTGYFKQMRENIKNHKIDIVDSDRAISLWKEYQDALGKLYAKAEQRKRELWNDILKVSEDACTAADHWYFLRKKWSALVGDEITAGIPLVLTPSQKLAQPYRKHQLMRVAGIAEQ